MTDGGAMALDAVYNTFVVDPWNSFVELIVQVGSLNPDLSYFLDRHEGVFSIWTLMCSVATALLVVFAILGILRDTTDIRMRMTTEQVLSYFLRLAVASGLIGILPEMIREMIDIGNSLALAIGGGNADNLKISDSHVFMTARFTAPPSATVLDYFENIPIIGKVITYIETVVDFIRYLPCFILLMVMSIVCLLAMYKIAKTILLRLFDILVLIPYAPVAFATFAGGSGFSETAWAWIRSFIGACCRLALIYIILIACGLLSTNIGHVLTVQEGEGAYLVVLMQCTPILCTSAMVANAEQFLSRALSL